MLRFGVHYCVQQRGRAAPECGAREAAYDVAPRHLTATYATEVA